MGVIVMVGYQPKEGKAQALDTLMQNHVQRLRDQGLVTDRAAILMKAQDGTVVEVFEWASKEAIESAHANPEVLKMWAEYAEVCDYRPLSELPETSQMFAEFEAV